MVIRFRLYVIFVLLMVINSFLGLISNSVELTLKCQHLCFYILKRQSIYGATFFNSKNNNLSSLRKACSFSSGFNEPSHLDFGRSLTEDDKEIISKNMLVFDSFLSNEEEKIILNEIEPYMKRLRYEFSHWDNAIHGYRETERLKWNEENSKIINRVREKAFPPGTPQLQHVHILDLAEDGYIKPHIDSVRFCGDTIAGLSLLTDSVMRLVHDQDKTKTVDVLLKKHSLYIMRNAVRYDYTHEILPNSESKFKQLKVEKKRRISIICRNEPNRSSQSET